MSYTQALKVQKKEIQATTGIRRRHQGRAVKGKGVLPIPDDEASDSESGSLSCSSGVDGFPSLCGNPQEGQCFDPLGDGVDSGEIEGQEATDGTNEKEVECDGIAMGHGHRKKIESRLNMLKQAMSNRVDDWETLGWLNSEKDWCHNGTPPIGANSSLDCGKY